MKVLSYNIAEGGAGRLREIAALIGRQRPDAVALIEANSRANAEELAARLGWRWPSGRRTAIITSPG